MDPEGRLAFGVCCYMQHRRSPAPTLRSRRPLTRGLTNNPAIIIAFRKIITYYRRYVGMDTLSKNRLKDLAAYKLQKHCDQEGTFVVEGVKMCNEALASGFRIIAACTTVDYLGTTALEGRADEVFEVTPQQLERLSNLRTPNKVWMLIERKANGGKQKAENGERLTLALDGIQDPGNLGTIMRTADWFGIRHIVCSHDTASCYNPKVVQASMGAVFRTEFEYTDLAEYLDAAQAGSIATYGAMLNGEPYNKTPLQRPAILVIGNEGRGISDAVAEKIRHRLTIPNIGGTCESLNAAVATAIICAEFYR